MLRVILAYLFLFLPFIGFSQEDWTWVWGDTVEGSWSEYGAEYHSPGSRSGSATWVDTSGNIWLFGGFGKRQLGGSTYLKDLWIYKPDSNLWVWIGTSSNPGSVYGSYGTQGVASSSNWPGARHGSVTWTDQDGIFWLFGGKGGASQGSDGTLNDLWQFDPSSLQWTWEGGSDNAQDSGTYGTKGVGDTSNLPPSRMDAVAWSDTAGNFWLFGGWKNVFPGGGLYNDLWRYQPSSGQWTWVSGSDTLGQHGEYGVIGIGDTLNYPGSRRGAVSWTDADNNLWLFGGLGFPKAGPSELLGDMWSFSPDSQEWTWEWGSDTLYQWGVFDSLGAFTSENKPGARSYARGFVDQTGDLWMVGGYSLQQQCSSGGTCGQIDISNAFWRFDVSLGQWSWEAGEGNSPISNGYLNVQDDENLIAVKQKFSLWYNMESLFIFGGEGDGYMGAYENYPPSTTLMNDLWRVDLDSMSFIWVKGAPYNGEHSIFGSAGTSSTITRPSMRKAAATWTDNEGDLWLFGGFGSASCGADGELGDLWEYDVSSSTWRFVNGTIYDRFYGLSVTKGFPNELNHPGGRHGANSWTDQNGRFWLYGGRGRSVYESGVTSGYLCDLWMFDPVSEQWTWVSGTNESNDEGSYGVLGVPDSTSYPRGRSNATSWKDSLDNLWVYGGRVGMFPGNRRWADLWKFNIQTEQWTWVKGFNQQWVLPEIDTLGAPDSNNKLGGLQSASAWVDSEGVTWIFGGYGINESGNLGRLSWLWKYHPSLNQWECVRRSSYFSSNGQLGVTANSNVPNTRYATVSWKDGLGDFWFFGGVRGNSAYSNELWKLNPSTTTWTWMGGDNSLSVYGAQGIAAPSNSIGARIYSQSWIDDFSKIFIYGGQGFSSEPTAHLLSDLWSVGLDTCLSVGAIINDQMCAINDSLSSICLTVKGAKNVLEYEWSNGEISDSILVPSGTYTVTVEDIGRCTTTASFFVDMPDSLELTYTVQSPLCAGDSNGLIAVVVSGGVGPFSYAWPDSSSNDSLVDISAGSYTITVHDDLGCVLIDSITVNEPDLLSIDSIVSIDVSCYGLEDGEASAFVSGGTSPYYYHWSDSTLTGQVLSLGVGTYSVTVTDSVFCSIVDSVTIEGPTQIEVAIEIIDSLNCISDSNSEVFVMATGSFGSFEFEWSNGSISDTVSNLSKETYLVTVTDTGGCMAIDSVEIVPISELKVELIQAFPIMCADDSTLVIALDSLGSGDVSYYWSTGQSEQDSVFLSEGEYEVTVTDTLGCLASDSIVLFAPQTLTVQIDTLIEPTCFGYLDGFVQLNAFGGTGMPNFLWSNGAAGPSIDSISAGVYIVLVIDSNECIDSLEIVVEQPDSLSIAIEGQDESCVGMEDGELEANVSGGVGAYSYAWNDADSQTTAIADSLEPGQYTLYLLDANGCEAIATDSIAEGSPLPEPELGPDTLFVASVPYTLIVSNVNVGSTFLWQDGSVLDSFNVLAAGTYWIQVTDSIGCIGTDSIVVEVFPTGVKTVDVGMSIFPNPVSHILTISYTSNYAKLNIWDAAGRYVLSELRGENKLFQVDMSYFSPGVYWVEIIAESGSTRQKLIKF